MACLGGAGVRLRRVSCRSRDREPSRHVRGHLQPRHRHFVIELDDAAQCHFAWTRRVLRCAVLRTSPDEDVLAEDAHRRCRLDGWLKRHRDHFGQFDAATVRHLDENHRQMHDAARNICRRILEDRTGDAGELDAFDPLAPDRLCRTSSARRRGTLN